MNENFNEFLIMGYNAFRRFCKAVIVKPRPNSLTLSSKSYYLVDIFKKSIKQDPTLFPIFKDKDLLDNWNRNTIETDRNQDVDYIFTEAYFQ